ncbi:MAG: tetratricopeptide repeat-containing sensor histidine kinase [Bacteroidales bacterium]|nr:tetratricopeptide repeat-containing sensor histidine kinase [Bacteroidales bacterium]
MKKQQVIKGLNQIYLFLFILLLANLSYSQNEFVVGKIDNKNIFSLKQYNLAKANSYYEDGIALLDEYELDDSRENLNKALEIFLSEKKFESIGNCYQNLGIIAEIESDFDLAIESYNLAIDNYLKIDFKSGLADAYNNLGIVYCINSQYEKGLDYYFKSLSIEEELGNEEGIAYSYGNIGLVYRKMNNNEKAIEYYNKSLEIKKRIQDKHGMAITYNNLGSLYVRVDSVDRAIELFNFAYQLNLDTENTEGQAYSLHNIGDALNAKSDYVKAIPYLEKSLEIRSKLNDEKGMTSSLFSLAEAYLNTKNYNKFISHIKSSYDLSYKMNLSEFMLKTNWIYYEYYSNISNPNLALSHLEEFVRIKKQVDEQERSDQILEMQARFDTDKKERELLEKDNQILVLEKEKKISDLQIAQDRMLKAFLLITVVLILVIVFILYKRYRNRTLVNQILEDKNNQLEEANATKNKFFSIISHDLSNYASVIESLSGMIFRKHQKMDVDMLEKNLHTLNKSAVENKNMIKSLLDWALAQSRRIKTNPQLLNASEYCNSLVLSLQNIAAEKNISLKVFVESNFVFYADKNTMETVLRNLISNAIKFSADNSEIQIYAKQDEQNMAEFVVRDFGIGMSMEDASKLFRLDVNPNTIGDNPNKGTGFGLILCKEFVHMNNGSIYVKSELGKGTDFIFNLPIK